MKVSCKHIVALSFVTALLCSGLSAGAQTAKPAGKDTTAPASSRKFSGSVMVTGSVTDAASGRRLAGIQVAYKDYTAAITDSTGSFSLEVPDLGATITIGGESFQQKEIALKGRGSITTSLYEKAYNSVYDVAYIPFGERPKNRLVNAAVSVQTQGNWTHNDETPDAYLQGQVAGLNVTRRSGTPGIGANLYLRGFTSLYATNQSLIVVDGVIFDNTSYGNSIIPGHVDNPLSFIDPKDIDNITVIKDGSSTYGTRAANGVILITTSRARQLPTKIDFAAYAGANFAPAELPVMNAADYRTYLSDILKTGGLTDAQVQGYPFFNDDTANDSYFRYHSNMDWQKQVFTNSMENNYYLKVSGGDDVARYSLSMGALKNEGVIKNTSQTKYNTRFNADFNLNQRLKAFTNLSFTFNDQKMAQQGISPATNPIYTALVKAPFIAPHVVSAKGFVSPIYSDADTLNVSNPLAQINNMQDNSKSYRFSGAIGFDYKIKSDLDFITTFGVTLDKVRESFFVPGNGIVHDTLPFGVIALNRSGSQVKQFYSIFADSRLAYTRTFSRIHQLSASLGIRYNQDHSEQDIGLGFNSPTDQFVTVGQGLASLRRTGGNNTDWKWLNSYFSANYNLLDKYFLDLNMAADASSRFGDAVRDAPALGGYRVALLPSVGASWLISSENFFAGVRWLDLLKLRASFSLTGNDDIGNYNNRQIYVSQNLLGLDGLVRGNIKNPHIQWEQVSKINIGADAAFLKERLSLSLDVFKHTTTKMLIDQSFGSTAGLDQIWTNSGGMETKGIDLGINGRIINTRSLKWDLGLTLAAYKNTVNHLPDNPILTSYAGATMLTQSGKAANLFYGYKTARVYVSDADAANDGYMSQLPNGTYAPFKGGDIRFVDMNGDKIIDEKDRKVIGNPNPNFTGSASTRLAWNRLALEALVTFSEGNDIYNYTRYQLESMSGLKNQTEAIRNRWRADGQSASIPRAALGDPMGNSRFSNRWIEDGSYIRLRTVSISYEVPMRPGFVKYTMLYLSGNNLLTLTKYKGYDPETSSTGSVFGQGVDIPSEPLYRSVRLGIRIGL